MKSGQNKKYPKAIANWPLEERPREKLILKGPESLSDAELLAIFLRVGVRGKNAIVLAKELLARFGSLRGLYAAPVDELRAILGIGDAKIAQFKAVIEMSKRYLAEGFHDRPYVESSDDIMQLLSQEMRDLDQEVFKVILLNGQNLILNILEVAKGSLASSKVYPREVVKIALRYSAAALVFVHNHPSGVAKASEDDKKLTRELFLACRLIGIEVHDHIIIGDNNKFSFADAGLIDQYAKELVERKRS
ncbi:MAG TPA: DNA repair protein RadC [Syntrophales bacterium]|nr:DNA repair protein RadC [Syntrophales bacterium]